MWWLFSKALLHASDHFLLRADIFEQRKDDWVTDQLQGSSASKSQDKMHLLDVQVLRPACWLLTLFPRLFIHWFSQLFSWFISCHGHPGFCQVWSRGRKDMVHFVFWGWSCQLLTDLNSLVPGMLFRLWGWHLPGQLWFQLICRAPWLPTTDVSYSWHIPYVPCKLLNFLVDQKEKETDPRR